MANGYDKFFNEAKKLAETNKGAKPAARKKTLGELRAQMQKEMLHKRQKARRKPFPLKSLLSCILGTAIAGVGFMHMDEVENFVKKVEIKFLGSALAEDTAPAKKATAKPTGATDATEAKAGTEAPAAGEAKSETKEVADTGKPKEYSKEDLDHFSKLNDRKRELDAREEELNRMETQLQTQQTELEKKITEIEKSRKQISAALEERIKGDEAKVDTLVQVYSNMKPQQAAKVFEAMDEDLAVEILGKMKKKNAAEIMNLLKAEKAQIFSERYAGYKK